jgi:hypothetical protein
MEEKTERSWRLSSATNTHAHVMGFKKKSEGLVFGMPEASGFLRAARDLVSQMAQRIV